MSDDIDKGKGSGLLDGMSERRGLNLLRRAVGEGWDMPANVRNEAPAFLEGVMRSSSDDRARLKAVEILRQMAKDNVEAAVALDRVNRLEAGDATENAAVTVRFVNRINGEQGERRTQD